MRNMKIVFATAIVSVYMGITAFAGQWQAEGPTWKYIKDDGNPATSEWIIDDGEWYHFDDTGVMQTGWVLDNEKWYFLGSNGAMFSNIYTPKGYYVGPDGAWIPNYNPHTNDDDGDSSSQSNTNGSTSNSSTSDTGNSGIDPGLTDGPR